MRLFRFLFSALLCLALFWLGEGHVGSVPHIGKMLDPVNGLWAQHDQAWKGNEGLDGLSEEVTMAVDSVGIPHLYAQSEADLHFAQGYATAHYRLFQMDLQTRAAAGRLSEWIDNEEVLAHDRLQRRMGALVNARELLEHAQAEPTSARALANYTKGVNAYLAQLQYRDYPMEYKLLNVEPEAWTPLRTCLLLQYLAVTLAKGSKDTGMTEMYRLLGDSLFNHIFPERLSRELPVVTENDWQFDPVPVATPDSGVFALPAAGEYRAEPEAQGMKGSNNWAIAPSRTASGNAILASDPHLQLSLPSIWLPVHLSCPTLDVAGFSLPGCPGVIMGWNRQVAWALTNAPRDAKDWYKITFRSEDRDEYLSDGRWLKTQKVPEEIFLKDGSSLIDTVVYTHLGPVVYDSRYPAEEQLVNFSMKWTAAQPGNEMLAFLLINKARNHEDFRLALKHFNVPAQNAAFASTLGNIAMHVAGQFPLKWPGQGKFLMEGSSASAEWTEYIPRDHNMYALNPDSGFVASANQIAADSTYPYWLYYDNYEQFRNRRIAQRLSSNSQWTAQGVQQLQLDNYSLKAAEVLPVLLDSASNMNLNPGQQEVVELLSDWDFYFRAEQQAPLAFQLWWQQLRLAVFDEVATADGASLQVYPSGLRLVELINDAPLDTLWDNASTPTREDMNTIIYQSLAAAAEQWQSLQGTTWGQHKESTFRHLLRLPALSVERDDVDGEGRVINANTGDKGASMRMVVELSSPPKAWFTLPGGPTGNPADPDYTRWLDHWVQGQHQPFAFTPLDQLNPSHTYRLLP